MKRRIGATVLSLAIFFIIGWLTVPEAVSKDGFSINTGMEYQRLSQKYYNALIDTTSLDAIERWVLARDDIDEFLSKTSVQYQYRGHEKRYKILSNIDLSEERWVAGGEGSAMLGNYKSNIKLLGRFEYKSPFDGTTSDNLGYTHLYSYLKGTQEVMPSLLVGGRLSAEQLIFHNQNTIDSPDSLSGTVSLFRDYDYSVLGGGLNAEYHLSEFGKSIFWEASFHHRFVPDSVYAAYNQLYTGISYSGFGTAGHISFETSLEYKDYAQPDNQDDFLFSEMNAHVGYNLSDLWEVGLVGSAQNYAYRQPDVVNRDNTRIDIETMITRTAGDWNVGPKGRFEIYSERYSSEIDTLYTTEYSENYNQWEAGGHVSYFSSSAFLLDAEGFWGHRSYTGAGAVISSYNLVSLSLMASWTLYKRVSINIFFDGDFEYHDVTEDNSDLYLLSFSVSTRL